MLPLLLGVEGSPSRTTYEIGVVSYAVNMKLGIYENLGRGSHKNTARMQRIGLALTG